MRMHSQLAISNTMALRRSSEKSRIWCQVLHYAVNRSNIKFQVRTRDRRIEAFFSLSFKPTLFLKTPAFSTTSSHTLGILYVCTLISGTKVNVLLARDFRKYPVLKALSY